MLMQGRCLAQQAERTGGEAVSGWNALLWALVISGGIIIVGIGLAIATVLIGTAVQQVRRQRTTDVMKGGKF